MNNKTTIKAFWVYFFAAQKHCVEMVYASTKEEASMLVQRKNKGAIITKVIGQDQRREA